VSAREARAGAALRERAHAFGPPVVQGVRYRGKRVGLQALTLFGSTNCDIADCLLAARARSRHSRVVSFDHDFKKLGCAWEHPA